MTRLLFALLLLPVLSGCSELAEHGPVSAKVLQQMEASSLTKSQFLQRIPRTRLLPAQPVTLPFRMIAGVPVMEVKLSGRRVVPMMVDTGATRTMIHAGMAAAHDVPVMRAQDATVELRGVVGREQGRIGLLDPLVLGGWSLNGYPCLVRTYENRVLNRRGTASFPDSFLGFDVALQHCTFLTLDYRSKQVTFGFGSHFRGGLGPRATRAPFQIKQGVPFITLKSGGKSWEAIVDTGSFNGIEISEPVALHLGVQDQGEKVRGLYLMAVGGTVTSSQANLRTVKLPDLTLLGDRYQDISVDIAPGPSRVGSLFLKGHRVTFDFGRKLLWLEW